MNSPCSHECPMPPTYQITPAPGGVSRGFTHVPHLRAIHATLRTRASLLLPLTCAGPRHAGACCFGGPLACWAWPCAPADVAHGHGPAEKKRRQPTFRLPAARPRTWRRRAGGRRDHVRGAGCRNPSRLFHAPRAWGVLSPWRRATHGIAALFIAIRVLLCWHQDAWGRMWLPRPPTPSNASAHL